MNPISRLTKDYQLSALSEVDLDPDPLRQFGRWLDAAVRANVPEPSAMTLATATRDGFPSARIVLLKDFDSRGFTFFTNYRSQKGVELEANPKAALLFFWPALERQVRISGSVSLVSREESAAYFHSRPIGSQIGAWASRQSERLESRKELDDEFQRLEREYEGRPVPVPAHWGGYRVQPDQIEFWQGGPNRLHDRFRYARSAEKGWKIDRLFP